MITVNSVTINPLRTSVQIKINEDNDMETLSINDIELVNEKGEEWASITNGTTRTGSNEDGLFTYYLQSNYFEQPEELYLEFSKAQAVPVGENYLEFDLDREKYSLTLTINFMILVMIAIEQLA